MIPFVLIALLVLASATLAMCLRNLVHSVLLLAGSWAGIAAFYLWAGAEFVAFAQALIYLGAISMLALFAVLLTRRGITELEVLQESIGRAAWAIVTAGAVAGVLIGAVLSTPFGPAASEPPALTVRDLGTALGGSAAAALLVIGVLLTVALLGGVVLASRERNPKP